METTLKGHLGGCQEWCRIIIGIQRGPIILTATHFTINRQRSMYGLLVEGGLCVCAKLVEEQ